MQKIFLTQDKFALVDDRDYCYLSQWKWYAVLNKSSKKYYAMRASNKNDNIKSRTNFYMHKIITSTNKKQVVDHQDHDTLNNTRENLKIGNNLDNQKNQKLFSTNTSGYAGVTFCKRSNKWRASIGFKCEYITLGEFIEKNDAILCRKKAEVEYGYHKNHGVKF